MDLTFVINALFDLNFAASDRTEASNLASLVIVFSRVKSSLVGRDLYVSNHQVVAVTRGGVGTQK